MSLTNFNILNKLLILNIFHYDIKIISDKKILNIYFLTPLR